MELSGTVLIYALVGLAVAGALATQPSAAGLPKRAVSFAAATVFWPLYAALLLGGRGQPAAATGQGRSVVSARIQRAEGQLLAALGRVKGLAEDVLAPEVARVQGLSKALSAMERRIEQMDLLLQTPEFDAHAVQALLADLRARGVAEGDPRHQSLATRLRNIERLRGMRRSTAEDLERTVLKIEEMTSQLQLLEFAGRSDAEVVRAIKEIAESVGDVTEELLASA
jgi:hypothetical protein